MKENILEKGNAILRDVEKYEKILHKVQHLILRIQENNRVQTRVGIAFDNAYASLSEFHIDTPFVVVMLRREEAIIKSEIRRLRNQFESL